jgi:hypothetical protein
MTKIMGNKWKWYRKDYKGYIAWTHFVQILYACFNHDIHYLELLKKLCQTGTFVKYIIAFDKLAIHTED